MDPFERRVALKRIDDIQKKLNEGLVIEGYLARKLQAVRKENNNLHRIVVDLGKELQQQGVNK
tara:strand:- start:604 stop:792 length:189 start_codon:yes stop_codon:yes gene_type:complete